MSSSPTCEPKAAATTTDCVTDVYTITTDSDRGLKRAKERAVAILIDSDVALQESLTELQRARELAGKAGLSIESCIVKPIETTAFDSYNPTINMGNTKLANDFTGGHSNTDHVVVTTGDDRVDRIAELKRNLLRRHRAMQPEQRGEERWDKPKIPGERRRRIVREQDKEGYPPEPPTTGWNVFIYQMTIKIRHDRPDERHDQSKVVQELGKIWRLGMSTEEHDYYTTFDYISLLTIVKQTIQTLLILPYGRAAADTKKEYDQQVIEFRATGSYQPSKHFVRMENSNVWIRKDFPTPLEKEISSYETIHFPKRPPKLDKEYEEREMRSTVKRKLKLKGLLGEDGETWKKGVDFEAEVEKERNKRLKHEDKCEDSEPEESKKYDISRNDGSDNSRSSDDHDRSETNA